VAFAAFYALPVENGKKALTQAGEASRNRLLAADGGNEIFTKLNGDNGFPGSLTL